MLNRSISKFATPLLAILLVTTAMANGQSTCQTVKASGITFAVGPFTFQGSAVFNIGRQDHDVSVTTNLLGPPRETGGVLHASTTHLFVFQDGSSIVTLDKAVLSPTQAPGFYNLNSRLDIVGGSGIYENACGGLTSGGGTIDLIGGEANWRSIGQVCTCE